MEELKIIHRYKDVAFCGVTVMYVEVMDVYEAWMSKTHL
jgi:hypothetical protein